MSAKPSTTNCCRRLTAVCPELLCGPVVSECGEGRELLLTEPVTPTLLITQKDAQAHGGAVGEFFDVPSSDHGLLLALDVLLEGCYAPLERVGALHCPSLRTAPCRCLLGPCSRFHARLAQAVLLFRVQARPVPYLPRY